MLDIGFSEILVIFVLALIVLGPEKLPRVAAQVGKIIGRARAMARQFREQLEEEVNVEAARKSQASSPPAVQPVPLPHEQTGGQAAEPPAPVPDLADAAAPPRSMVASAPGVANESGHADLTNDPWPHAAPVPPPEVTDVFGDLLAPADRAPAQVAVERRTVPGNSNEADTARGITGAPPAAASPLHWPHDHDVPPPSAETQSAGLASETHEHG